MLLYADGSEALTHPYLAHAWAEKGAGLRAQAPGASSADFVRLLRRLDWRYGPKPGCERLSVVLVLNGGPIHTSKASRAALPERPWITVEWLPRYAPELSDIKRSGRDLKRHHLTRHTFKDADDLTCAIHAAVKQLSKERQTQRPCDRLNKAA